MGIDPPAMREMVADYYNSLARLDACVGELLATLEKSGKASNTIVIYIGDHGADMLRGKRTSYEGGLRIPLILRWPGHAKPQVRQELVSTVDLLPTLLATAAAPDVPGLAGRSLQPLLSDAPAEWRTHLFSEYHTHAAGANYHPQRAVRTDRFKLIENLLPDTLNPDYADTFRKLEGDAKDRGQAGFKGGLSKAIAAASPEVRAAYAVMEKPPRYELYDLHADPHEFRNLAASPDHASTLAELQKQLTAWREQTQDPLLNPQNLHRLTAEVTAVKGKSEGKAIAWGYPDYFFGKEPAATTREPPKKKKKKKQ
jgi:N-sulfoglucosamine sulfohydrolase